MPGDEKFADAFSRGDVMRRLDILEQKIQAVQSGRSLQAATVGSGGVRVKGGTLTVQDGAGDDMFRAGGVPGEVFIRADLLTPLSIAIFADRIRFGIESSIRGFTVPEYELDLPTVEDVEVSETGVMLVFLTCHFQLTAADSLIHCTMAAEISGATQVSPEAFGAYGGDNTSSLTNNNASAVQKGDQQTTLAIVTGLNPRSAQSTSGIRQTSAHRRRVRLSAQPANCGHRTVDV